MGRWERWKGNEVAKWEVAAILGNGCGVQGQNCVAWLQGSKMSVGGW